MDIYKVRNVAKKMKVKDKNLYHRLNFAFKGAIGQLSNKALEDAKRVLTEEHEKAIAFINDLQAKQTPAPVQVEKKSA